MYNYNIPSYHYFNSLTVTVNGYIKKENKDIEDFITIDWKNKTFTYTDPGSGEKIVYDGSVCK